MEIKRYIVGETEYEFVCESYSNSRAWGHKVTVIRDQYIKIAENKIRYYNRTWEAFQYQTCMLGALSTKMEDIIKKAYFDYKTKNGLSRLSATKKAEIVEDVKENHKVYNDLAKIYKNIYNGNRKGGEI